MLQAEPLSDWSGVEYKTWTAFSMLSVSDVDAVHVKLGQGRLLIERQHWTNPRRKQVRDVDPMLV